MRVLVLGSTSIDTEEAARPQRLQRYADMMPAGTDVKICFYDLLEFDFRDGFMIRDRHNDAELTAYDLVVLKGGIRNSNLASAVNRFLKASRIPYVNDFTAYRSLNKLQQLMDMDEVGVRFPSTTYISDKELLKKSAQKLGFPLVVKALEGSKGRLNFKVEDQRQLDQIIKDNQGRELMLQQYVQPEADFRIFIAGQDYLILRRYGRPGSFQSNISQGGTQEIVKEEALPELIINQAKALAERLKLDIAGVDIIKAAGDDEFYFLEINSQPAIGQPEILALLKKYLTDVVQSVEKNE